MRYGYYSIKILENPVRGMATDATPNSNTFKPTVRLTPELSVDLAGTDD
jgi:hypothetical protein